MKLRRKVVSLIWILFYQWTNVFASSGLYNVTVEAPLNRDKRFVIFEGFGIHKFIAGFSVPVSLEDKKPWRSLGAVYNLQGQYLLPTKPIYWWDRWDGRSLLEAKLEYENYGTYVLDESRIFLYALLEYFMDRSGKNGKKCLLRAICEHAIIDEVDGVIGEIIDAMLTPTKDSAEEFRDAYDAGRYGAVCTTLYPECPLGTGLLDGLTKTEVTGYFSKSEV